VLLVGAAWRTGWLPNNSDPSFVFTDTTRVAQAVGAPPPEHLGHKRLAPQAPASTTSTSFAFLRTVSGGKPVTWSPCDPVEYVVRRDGVTDSDRVLLAAAFTELALRTGLTFRDAGWTDEAPRQQRPAYQPERYGKRWAPVLVAWSTPAESAGLDGGIAGIGGPTSWGLHPNQQRYVSGIVVLDGPQLAELARERQGAQGVRNVLLHELGHLAGLGHVNDPTQLMNPQTSRDLAGYSDGDLHGLSLLGRGACRA
jgi:hypothetical protein